MKPDLQRVLGATPNTGPTSPAGTGANPAGNQGQ